MSDIKINLIITGFRSQYDEEAFIEWMQKIKSIKRINLYESYDIYFDLNKPVSRSCMHELFGLFERYRINKERLLVLKNDDNKSWFENHDWANPYRRDMVTGKELEKVLDRCCKKK